MLPQTPWKYLLHIALLSWVFCKEIFRALGFSSCCCCTGLEMLADEVFRIYSDENFDFALWARLEFRPADSTCEFESGIDPYHTCIYNPLAAVFFKIRVNCGV